MYSKRTKYSASDIAQFFIKKEISPLKLQKLLYYSQVWYFVKHDRKLFSDKIKAWVYGPVIGDIWFNFKFMKRSSLIPTDRAFDVHYDDDVLDLLNQIWNSYGHLSGSELVDLTHSERPWLSSRVGLLHNEPSDKEVRIDSSTIKDFKLSYYGSIPFVEQTNSHGRYSTT